MTKAGLDPSRIEERAVILAKVHAAKKRKRDDDDDAEMDTDEDHAEAEREAGDEGKAGAKGKARVNAGEEEWMDVDEEDGDGKRRKKVRGNKGEIMFSGKRHPRSNRQLAGLRDDTVSCSQSISFRARNSDVPLPSLPSLYSVSSKLIKPINCAILTSGRGICWPRPARATAQSKPRW